MRKRFKTSLTSVYQNSFLLGNAISYTKISALFQEGRKLKIEWKSFVRETAQLHLSENSYRAFLCFAFSCQESHSTVLSLPKCTQMGKSQFFRKQLKQKGLQEYTTKIFHLKCYNLEELIQTLKSCTQLVQHNKQHYGQVQLSFECSNFRILSIDSIVRTKLQTERLTQRQMAVFLGSALH